MGSTITSFKIFDYRLRLTWAISTTNRPNRSSRIDWGDLNRFRPLQGKNAQSVQIDLVSWSKPHYCRITLYLNAHNSIFQAARERIEHHLEHMNAEASSNSATKLWRRISMINVSSYRKIDNQLDVLGNTTWGIRKASLVQICQKS